jgi:hypothetical protein
LKYVLKDKEDLKGEGKKGPRAARGAILLLTFSWWKSGSQCLSQSPQGTGDSGRSLGRRQGSRLSLLPSLSCPTTELMHDFWTCLSVLSPLT